MKSADSLSYRATLEEYQRQAQGLFDALKSADEAAEWRVQVVAPTIPRPVCDRREGRDTRCSRRASGRRA